MAPPFVGNAFPGQVDNCIEARVCAQLFQIIRDFYPAADGAHGIRLLTAENC
jgi:hypothetical protein